MKQPFVVLAIDFMMNLDDIKLRLAGSLRGESHMIFLKDHMGRSRILSLHKILPLGKDIGISLIVDTTTINPS